MLRLIAIPDIYSFDVTDGRITAIKPAYAAPLDATTLSCRQRFLRPFRDHAALATAKAADLAPIIAELKATGATSLRAIAAGLNERGVPTAGGKTNWSAAQVARILAPHS